MSTPKIWSFLVVLGIMLALGCLELLGVPVKELAQETVVAVINSVVSVIVPR